MGGGQIVHTVCMHTRDAISRKEGEFTMQLAGDQPRFSAVKLMLGSLEFPMVQWSIEEEWNRIYFSEGYRLSPDSSYLKIVEDVNGEHANEILLRIPPRLNQVIDICDESSRGSTVKCRFPHGLWANGRRCLVGLFAWGDVELLCGSLGRVSLKALHATGQLEYVSEHEFLIPRQSCDITVGGYLHAPAYPSPSALCEVLTYALAFADGLAAYEIVYDAPTNRATLQATMYPENAQMLGVRLYGSELATILGYPSALHERRFHRGGPENAETMSFDFFKNSCDRPPLVLPSEPFNGWMYAELDPGWYTPAQRPMCTGQPLRLPQEFELSMNRLNFGMVERIPQGMVTAHFLVFCDPSGAQHMCPVYIGRYSAEQLALVLETEMTRQCKRSEACFTVEFEENRFRFTCETRRNGKVEPAAFTLLFNHPAQFDPSRIGFRPVCLSGFDTYSSAFKVNYPSEAQIVPRNLYRIQEIGHQKRFRIQTTPQLEYTGVILGYDTQSHTLILRTHLRQIPCAHGLQPGDIVYLSASNATEVATFQDDMWQPMSVSSCPVGGTGKGVVVEMLDSKCRDDVFVPNCEQIDVAVRVKPTHELVDAVGQCLTLTQESSPFNLCFGSTRSVPGHLLGFPSGASEWGRDGSANSGSFQIPPFDAPYVHALDHPEYVLLYIDDIKKNVGLQHGYGRNNTTPFAKIVLFPMVREERMLPRDTSLLSGENLATFTLRFCNPDGTPYHFHGANFSFSLNFIDNQ